MCVGYTGESHRITMKEHGMGTEMTTIELGDERAKLEMFKVQCEYIGAKVTKLEELAKRFEALGLERKNAIFAAADLLEIEIKREYFASFETNNSRQLRVA